MLSAPYRLLCVALSTTFFFTQQVRSQGADPIVIKGSKFFHQNNGSQFFIKGVIYQQVPSNNELGSVAENLAASSAKTLYVDPLADPAACARDIPYLQDLQTNVIRTYGIDPSRNHSQCMTEFANAGIYVIADLVAPGYTIGSVNPVWNNVLYNRYTSVIDIMHNYTNLLGFVLGDDVVNGVGTNDSGPYVKAAVRDMKSYIRQNDYRSIPVGYVNSVLQGSAVAQISTAAKDIWQYLNCGDKSDNIDFWGANIVDWCKGSSFTISGYKNATSELSAYSVPVFLATYGCSIPSERDFSEIPAIYSQVMTQTWSGGIIYEYFEQSNPGYGLVSVDGASVKTAASSYPKVSSRIAKVSPSSVNSATYTPTNIPAACPADAAKILPPNPKAVGSASSSTRQSTPGSPKPSTSTAPPLAVSNNALSTGAKVGIGIGSAVFVVVLGLGMFLVGKRAKERKRIHQERDQNGQWTKTELAADDVDREARGYGPHMPASTERAEVEDTGVMREVLADSGPIFEAPGDLPAVAELSGPLRGGDPLMQNNEFSR